MSSDEPVQQNGVEEVEAKQSNVQNEDDQPDDAWTKFDREATFADAYFLYQSWAAWSVIPENKTIAPIARVVIGDENGNIVFNRPVVLTGIADLMNELAGTLVGEISRANDMAGFSLHIPSSPSTLIQNLKGVVEKTSTALKMLEVIHFSEETSEG